MVGGAAVVEDATCDVVAVEDPGDVLDVGPGAGAGADEVVPPDPHPLRSNADAEMAAQTQGLFTLNIVFQI